MPSAEPTAGGAAPVRLTMLSSMADPDFEKALDRHVRWRIRDLDLKDRILGQGLLDLTAREAERAAELIRARGLSVYCLSTLENRVLFTQGMWGEMMHFCECALAGRPASRGTLELALEVMRVYEAALLSEGRRALVEN